MGLNKGRVGQIRAGHIQTYTTYLPTHISAFLTNGLTFITLDHLTYRHTYLPTLRQDEVR